MNEGNNRDLSAKPLSKFPSFFYLSQAKLVSMVKDVEAEGAVPEMGSEGKIKLKEESRATQAVLTVPRDGHPSANGRTNRDGL